MKGAAPENKCVKKKRKESNQRKEIKEISICLFFNLFCIVYYNIYYYYYRTELNLILNFTLKKGGVL